MRVKRGVVGPRRPGATSLSSYAGTDVVGPRLRKPTQFDDQRPGWDFTSGDVGKFKLTEEQVKVSHVRFCGSRVAPRWSSPDVSGSRATRTPCSRLRIFEFFTEQPTCRLRFLVSQSSARLTAVRLPTAIPFPPGATRSIYV